MVENYSNGRLSGLTENYYPSGSVSQQLYYNSDQKNGPWTRFFENGDTMMKANYTEGMLHGEYISFYPEGKLQITGTYVNDLKDGDWNYFSEEGEILSVIKYDNGTVLNPDELQKSYEKLIRVLEETEGELTDPEAE
jgi:antitoxin component YwqK of YwqJK toxin-antitoxin module